jgi:hypothetical protein
MEVAIVVGAAIIAAAIVFGGWSIAASLQGLVQVFGHAFSARERWVSHEEYIDEHAHDDGGVTFKDHLPPWSNPSFAEIFAWHHWRGTPEQPGRLIGHMHLSQDFRDTPPVDPAKVDPTWLKRLADAPWTWVITDPAGVVLRQVPAQTPSTHDKLSLLSREMAMKAEATQAASEVFPVCSVRAARCGYRPYWAFDVVL